MVEVSLTALRLRLVLKWRTGLDSVAFEEGVVAGMAGPREAPVGLSEVRMEEKVAGPVMWRLRVWTARKARMDAREACIVM
jgi:hypothetical protein